MEKSFLVSKRFWLNFLAGVIALLSGSQFLDIFPAEYARYFAASVFALNILLAKVSDSTIAFSTPGTIEKQNFARGLISR